MNDRELLELAAKAAGLEFTHGYHEGKGFLYFPPRSEGDNCKFSASGCFWNPRTDDGDALRLAVKLGFFIDIDLVRFKVGIVWRNRDLYTVDWTSEDGHYAATREAITCAAAEVGKNMVT